MGKKNQKRVGAFEIPNLKNPSKTVLANIRFASVDERVKTIVVTSSTPDEGKTTVCSNLACAMASAGHKVLIIDTDMRRRCLASMLDIHPTCGLYAVLSGEAQLKDAIVSTQYENLWFMDSEPKIPNPPDLLSTQRFAALVDRLREMYDYVIFDTPPLGAFVDAALVANLVDGAILVVRERKTKRNAVDDALQQLKAANARVLGCVMSFTSDNDNDYYYAYYNEKGERVQHSESDTSNNASSFRPMDGNLEAWARRTGVETTGTSTHGTRGSANASARRNASRTGHPHPNGNSRPNAGNGGGYANASGQTTSNPYATGAFKAVSPEARQPRHKSRRI